MLSLPIHRPEICVVPAKPVALFQDLHLSPPIGWAQPQTLALGAASELLEGCLGSVTSPMSPHAAHPLPLPALL